MTPLLEAYRVPWSSSIRSRLSAVLPPAAFLRANDVRGDVDDVMTECIGAFLARKAPNLPGLALHAGCREDPRKDVVDDLVLREAVLAWLTRVITREAPLGRGVELPVLWMRAQPVAEEPVPCRFGRVLRPDVQVDIRVRADEHPVPVPPRLPEHQSVPGPFQSGEVAALVRRVVQQGDRCR